MLIVLTSNRITLWSSNYATSNLPEEYKNTNSKGDTHLDVYSSIIYNNIDFEVRVNWIQINPCHLPVVWSQERESISFPIKWDGWHSCWHLSPEVSWRFRDGWCTRGTTQRLALEMYTVSISLFLHFPSVFSLQSCFCFQYQ